MESTNEHTSELRDEDLCALACGGDRMAEEQLVVRYQQLTRACSRPYFLAGGDSEDLIQEAMFGLLKAIRLYDGRQSAFATFASVCVASTMATAAKAALSQKSRPLSDYSPLEELDEARQDQHVSPEEEIIIAEQVEELKGRIDTLLSGFEQRALTLYLSGHSYSEISQLLRTTSKAVDNALQRVRRKLRSV